MKSVLSVVSLSSNTDYSLVSVDDVLLELQLENPTQAQTDLIQKHIIGVSAAISKYCDRVFVSETVEETFWEPNLRYSYNSNIWPYCGPHALYLARYPVTAIDSIYVDDVALTSDSNDSGQRLDSENGILYRLINGAPSYWSFSKSIVVTYTGGYISIPEDIQRVAIRWSEMAFFASAHDPSIKSEQVYNIASVTYSAENSMNMSISNIPDEFKSDLNLYRRKGNFA